MYKMDCVKMTFTLLLAFFSLAAARTHFPGHFHAALTQDNSLSPMRSNNEREDSMKDWVKITDTERTIRVSRGQRLEVDCEAIGSPSPRIQWQRGSRPVTQMMEEDNEVRGFGLAKVVRTFVADCALPTHEGVYTCFAVSGGVTAESDQTRVVVEDSDDMRSDCHPGAPKINLWAPIVMQTMGSDVKIPCRVHGGARVSWVTKDGQLVSNFPGSRFRVLDSGDLVISKLKWIDMGKYSCYAENEIGKDTVSTFLYPMLNEN